MPKNCCMVLLHSLDHLMESHDGIHLISDVELYGPLDKFSAFEFESFLEKLKSFEKAYPHSVTNYTTFK